MPHPASSRGPFPLLRGATGKHPLSMTAVPAAEKLARHLYGEIASLYAFDRNWGAV